MAKTLEEIEQQGAQILTALSCLLQENLTYRTTLTTSLGLKEETPLEIITSTLEQKLTKLTELEQNSTALKTTSLENTYQALNLAYSIKTENHTDFTTNNNQSNPNNANDKQLIELSIYLVKELRDTKIYDKALTLCNHVLSIDPKNPHAKYYAGTIHYYLKQYDKAIGFLKQLPTHSSAQSLLTKINVIK